MDMQVSKRAQARGARNDGAYNQPFHTYSTCAHPRFCQKCGHKLILGHDRKIEQGEWRCNEKGEPFRMAMRTSVLTCCACHRQASLTIDIVMQPTHTPPGVSFSAADLVSSLTPGMFAVQFQR
jgi:hypothetical protein